MSANRKPSQSSSSLAARVRKSALAMLCLTIALPSCSTSPTPIAQPTAPAVTPSPTPIASASATISPSPAASPIAAATKPQKTKDIETSLISTLAPQLPSAITAANCPNLEKLETGKAFDCQVTIAEGTFPATVTLKDDKGDFGVNTKNILVMPVLEKQLAASIKQDNKIDVKVDCGSPKVKIFKTVGETVECKLTQPNGRSGTATTTLVTLAGGMDAKWKIEQ